jgi:predicted ATPase
LATKHLVWDHGELFVKIASTGAMHPLTKLSSGENQVIVFMAELLRRWRPGSLILIDEPDLHLHPAWPATLWSTLKSWQEERGGQVIATTQSTSLFGIADHGTTLLLKSSLR